MFKDFIKEGTNVNLYPVISLVMMFVFFVALSVRAMMYKKKELNEMAGIPLDQNFGINNETTISHE